MGTTKCSACGEDIEFSPLGDLDHTEIYCYDCTYDCGCFKADQCYCNDMEGII